MVSTRRVELHTEIEIDVPVDILENQERFRLIQEGIIQSISKGLYEKGISFNIKKSNFRV
ncbi:MAG: hypothetical protein ACPKPY_11540 [Nitrososphaeraceae archaeon]